MNTSLVTTVSKNTRGLALVELIVVLLILALLAGTAITATQGMVEETFHDTTRTTLERIDEAILGPYAPPTAHDDTLLAGFVADVGRLPRVWLPRGAENFEFALRELWNAPTVADPFSAAFSVQTPCGDPCLRIPAGWRGPYLHFGLGAPRLLDGWGRAFEVFDREGRPATHGGSPGRIASRGADPLDGVTSDDTDIVIASTSDPIVLSRDHTPLTIRLEPAIEGGSTNDVLVRVYIPVNGEVHALQMALDDGSTAVTFVAIPVGPRVVRAYHWPSSNADDPLPDERLQLRSAPVTVRVARRGVAEVVLKVFAEPVLPCDPPSDPDPPCVPTDSR